MSRRRPVPDLIVAGVMTGTSCDAIDVSVLRFSLNPGPRLKLEWKVLANASAPYPSQLRKEVLAMQTPDTRVSLQSLLSLDRRVGLAIGDAVSRVLGRAGTLKVVDAVAIHGQTVSHHPAPRARASVEGLTLQIGSPEAVAMATGLTVLSHFRDGDILVGGQGAPLVPLFHREWVRTQLGANALRKGVAIHNIGGISNLTYLGPKDRVLAFDTGPGNAWIDEAARRATEGRKQFDRNGVLAASVAPSQKAMRVLLKDPFLKIKPPKSTGRDDYPYSRFLDAFDSIQEDSNVQVSTATEYTAASIEDAYSRFILKDHSLSRILICGGGALNPELLRRIRERMARHGVVVESMGQLGLEALEVDPQFMEAQAFAYLGLRCLQGKPVGGSWTGATSFAPPGRITPAQNFKKLSTKVSLWR